MDVGSVLQRVNDFSNTLRGSQAERLRRRALDPSDFVALRNTGFPLISVPQKFGGLWVDPSATTRPMCEMLRSIARSDSSLALVCSMHATVVSFWSCYVDVPSDFKSEWERQCEEVFSGVKSGAWWGTITSEPGSGGDIRKSKAKAKKVTDSEHYELFGQKHFGSGCGASDFMITTAVPEDDENPDWFIVPMPPQPLDANVGVKIVAPWDGQGMAATQSHSIEFCGAKASRIAAPGNMLKVIEGPRGAVACAYSAVFVGIADEAMAQARTVIAKNQNDLDSFSRVEWVRAKKEAWLIQQAYEGMLNGMANEQSSAHTAQLGKLSIAELAESLLQRINHILGGSAYSRKSPFGFWLNDVRALGFLRPPWPLAYQRIFDAP